MRTFAAFLLLVATSTAAETKPIPAVPEPDWSTWTLPTREIGEKVQAAWKVLREHRPEKQYATPEESQAAGKSVEAAYALLEEHADASCAVGVYYLQRTKDDWERLMIGGTLLSLNEAKGEPFFVWALSKSAAVDALFPAVFHDACFVAEAQRVSDIGGLLWVLKTQQGAVMLPEYNWVIPTHDCLFYVFGRFGPEVVPYVRTALRDPDPYVRRNAAVVLGHFLDHQSQPELMQMLKAGGVPALGAAFALGEFGSRQAVPDLIRMLNAETPTDRLWAIYALYEIRAPETLPAIEKALTTEADERVQQELKAAIAHIKTPDAGVQPLTADELGKILAEAEKAIIPDLPFDRIKATVGKEHLPQLIRIRRLAIDEVSDEGHQEFQDWQRVLKSALRGGAVTR